MINLILFVLVGSLIHQNVKRFVTFSDSLSAWCATGLFAISLVITSEMWLLNLGLTTNHIRRFFIQPLILTLGFLKVYLHSRSAEVKSFKAPQLSFTSNLRAVMFSCLSGFFVLVVYSMRAYENDLLEYISVSRFLSNNHDFLLFINRYPLNETDWTYPVYAPSSHNPFFHTMLMFSLSSSIDWLALSLLFVFFCLALLSMSTFDKSTLLYTFLFFISTPLLVFATIGFYIDVPRLAFLSLGLRILVQNVESLKIQHMTAIVILVLSVHSLGIVSLVAILLITLFCATLPNTVSGWTRLVGYSFLASLFFVPQFFINIYRYGLPFQDSSPIQELNWIAWESDLLERRELYTSWLRLRNGVLSPLFEISLFGLIPILLLLIFLILLTTRHGRIFFESRWVQIHSLFLLTYFLITLISAALGFDSLIKNLRYQLTYWPSFFAILSFYLSFANRKIGSKK